jgi:hypothetical protein
MAFCSLLTARRIFKEVMVGFLVVGHTHEDIDAYFSYLSKLLKGRNTYVLADLTLIEKFASKSMSKLTSLR